MSTPDIPNNCTLFTLRPCNDDARIIVQENTRYLDSYEDTDCLSVKINHESKRRGRLLTFGRTDYRTDIVLSDSEYSFDHFFFTYSKDGQLILEDESALGNIQLHWHADANSDPDPKHNLKGYPRRRAIPFATPARITLEISHKAVFEFIWRVDAVAERAGPLREVLADVYELLYWDNKPLLETKDAALVEERCRNTPRVPREFEDKNVMEVHSYGKVGAGQFGTVYEVVDLAVGRILAMKVAKSPRKATSHGRPRQRWKVSFKEEVEKLASLQHPNIVGFIHSQGWTEGEPVQIFLELYRGSARQLFIPTHACTDLIPTADRVSIQLAYLIDHVLSALHFLHSRGFVHRDVKPDNILYQIRGYRKRPFFVLSDFGLVTQSVPADSASPAGSVDYMAPETARRGQHTPPSDMYAFGLCLMELMGIVCPIERRCDVRRWRERLDANDVEGAEQYRDGIETTPPMHPELEPSHSRVQFLLANDLLDASFQSLLHIDPNARVGAMAARQNLVHGEVSETRVLYSQDPAYEQVSFGLGRLEDVRARPPAVGASRGGNFVRVQRFPVPPFPAPIIVPQFMAPRMPMPMPAPMPMPMPTPMHVPPPHFAGPSMRRRYASAPPEYQYTDPASPQEYITSPMARQLLPDAGQPPQLPAPDPTSDVPPAPSPPRRGSSRRQSNVSRRRR